jgi:hypothetical protein
MALGYPCLGCSRGCVQRKSEAMNVLLDFFSGLLQAMVYCVILFWGLAFSITLAALGLALLTVLRERK